MMVLFCFYAVAIQILCKLYIPIILKNNLRYPRIGRGQRGLNKRLFEHQNKVFHLCDQILWGMLNLC